MKATLYKELSNKQTPLELQAGLSVQEALPSLDLENAIIVINGKIESHTYTLQENDTVTIRLTPSGTVALIATAITLAVVAVGAGIVGGTLAYRAKLQAEKAKAELEKIKKLSNSPTVDNRPFLRGASNTIATGNNQPYIIGKHFFTPYLLCEPFYKIAGQDGVNQYVYTVLECGFNKQIIKKISIDDIIIKTFSTTRPQEGGYSIDEGIFAEGGCIEIAQDGKLLSDIPSLNYKVESKTCNSEIPRDSDVADGKSTYLTYTLNPYAMNVDIAITFPYGLYAVHEGKKIETQVTITPQYSLDGGSSWTVFYFDNNGSRTNFFKRNVSTRELRFVAHTDFTAHDYEILKANNQPAIYIRIRSNGNAGDSSIKNDCYCLFYQSTCYDPDKSTSEKLIPCKIIEDRERTFCTILALKLKASKINQDKLKKINVITQGLARTWNGRKWSTEKAETRNPASWALEIETSDSHPASRYNDEELDLESFAEYYEYCEKKDYKFDWVITQNAKKDDILHHIMEATGACIYTDIHGRRAIAIDKSQENALAVYNPQNIISIQNKKTFGRRTDGLRIKYVNSKDDLYQEDTYLVMREVNGTPLEITHDSIIKDINITGITTFDHIVKYARRLMAIEALRPKTTIIEVGNEGVFYTPFSKVLIQDDSLKIGIGKGHIITETKWQWGLLKKIYTKEPLTFDSMKTYGIIVNCFTATGSQPMAIKVEGEGTTNELIVLTRIRASADAKPEVNNIFSFGELDADGEFSKIITPYIISQIRRSENGFNLELVNYHEAIYESGSIPDYKSNITKKATYTTKPIPPNILTREDLDNAFGKVDPSGSDAAQEAVNVVTHGVHFTNVYKIKDIHGINDSLDSLRSALDEVLSTSNNGLSITEDKLTSVIADQKHQFYSIIEQTATAIRTEVANENAKLRSNIEQTAEAIRTQVKNENAKLQSNIEQTADAIIGQVSNMEKELRSLINIQAGSVQAIVEGGGASGRMALSLELPAIIDASTLAKFINASSREETASVYAKLSGTNYYTIRGDASKFATKQLWEKAVRASLLASQIDLTATQINMAAEHVVITGSTNNGQTIIDGGYLRTALIDVEKLITKKLHIDTDKYSSQDFEAWFDGVNGLKIKNNGEEIFKVDKNGNVFMKKAFLQNGTFTGDIYSGPLELSSKTPSGRTFNFTAGETAFDCVQRINNQTSTIGGMFVSGAGVFNNEKIIGIGTSNISIPNIQTGEAYPDPTGWNTRTITFFAINGTEYTYTSRATLRRNGTQEITQNDTILYPMTFTEHVGSKTFRLKNLPINQPTDSNCIWRDADGYLRIT